MAQIKGCLKMLRPARHLTLLQRRAAQFQYQNSELEGETCGQDQLLCLASPFSGTPHQQFCTKPSPDNVSAFDKQDENMQSFTTIEEEQFISDHDIEEIAEKAVLNSIKRSDSFEYLLSFQSSQDNIDELNQRISQASFQRMAELLPKVSDETVKEAMIKEEQFISEHDYEEMTEKAVLNAIKSSDSFAFLLSFQLSEDNMDELSQRISQASFQRMAELLPKKSDETVKEAVIKEEQFISEHDYEEMAEKAVLHSIKSSDSFEYLLSVQFCQDKINELNQRISIASFQRMTELLGNMSDETVKEEMTAALFNSPSFVKASQFVHENLQKFDWTYKVSLFSCLVEMTDTDLLLTIALGNLLKIYLTKNKDVSTALKLIDVLYMNKQTKMRKLLFSAGKTVMKECKANKDRYAGLHVETPTLQEDTWKPLVEKVGYNEKSFSGLLADPSTLQEDVNSPVIQQIQSQALLNCHKINVIDIYSILYLLAKKKVRNAPLINALVSRLENIPLTFKSKKAMGLFFACSALSINNVEFLNSASNNLINNMSNFRSLSAKQRYYQVLISFSRLGWKHNIAIRGLINAVKNLLYINDLDKVKLVSLIVSLGHLNWTEHGEVIDSVMEKLEGFEKEDCVRWLDVVWSLSILNKATVKMVHGVLTEEYYHSIEQSVADKPKYILTSIQSKLLNLTGHAVLELKAPVKPAAYDTWMANFKDARAEYRNPLALSVGNFFPNIAPAQSCSSKRVLDYGNIVDFEMHEVQVAEKEPIKRVAVKVLRFQDMLRSPNGAEPDGRTAMSIRQLKQMGYHVLKVPYHEWTGDNSEKGAYLRDLIQGISEDL